MRITRRKSLFGSFLCVFLACVFLVDASMNFGMCCDVVVSAQLSAKVTNVNAAMHKQLSKDTIREAAAQAVPDRQIKWRGIGPIEVKVSEVLKTLVLRDNRNERYRFDVHAGFADTDARGRLIERAPSFIERIRSLWWEQYWCALITENHEPTDGYVQLRVHRFKKTTVFIEYMSFGALAERGLGTNFAAHMLDRIPGLRLISQPYDAAMIIHMRERAGFNDNRLSVFGIPLKEQPMFLPMVTLHSRRCDVQRPSGNIPFYLRMFFSRIMLVLFDRIVLVSGLENVDALNGKPAVFAFNHVSVLDSLLLKTILYANYGRYPYAVARAAKYPLYHRLMHNILVRPQEKGPTTGRMIAALKEGHDICIAPIGKIERDENDQFDDGQWRTGGAYAAYATQAPIVPVVIHMAYPSVQRKRGIVLVWEMLLRAMPWLSRLGVVRPLRALFYTPPEWRMTVTFAKPQFVTKALTEVMQGEHRPARAVVRTMLQQQVVLPLCSTLRTVYREDVMCEGAALRSC